MLNPNQDRLEYSQILSAPEGYQLDFAVGTTYSLDLDALVGACISLGLSEETDSDLMRNPICLLEALRATGNKLALFCQGGQIHLPSKVTSLYVLLEHMVYQVSCTRKNDVKGYPSFHPKFWLLRYLNSKKEPVYRVAVLSRNLTFDRSWDVSFYMNGKLTQTETDKNQPVIDFLDYLIGDRAAEKLPKEKKRKVRQMMKELPFIAFDPACREFQDFEFLPTGIRGGAGFRTIQDTQLFRFFGQNGAKEGLHETFIMSPFVSNDVIKFFNERNSCLNDSDCVLVTRAASLGKLKPEDCSNFRIYTMKDTIVQGETAISDGEGATAPQNQDIHAKVYLTRKYADTNLYLGSLNASHNAVYGNVEFMIRLQSKNRYLNMEKLTADLFGQDEGGKENPFQRVTLEDTAPDAAEEKQSLLESVIKDIARKGMRACISQTGEYYQAELVFASTVKVPEGVAVTVQPMLVNRPLSFEQQMLFEALPMTDLSEFYTIRVQGAGQTVTRVVKVPTEGIPEDREKAVISSVVNDRACFYRYIAFLLGDSMVISSLEDIVGAAGVGSGGAAQLGAADSLPPLYEKMLKTAATAPERFQEIGYLIQAISKDGVIPDEFVKLYQTFRKVVNY